MLPKILVLDTNVWLDDALRFRPGHDSASMLISSARHMGIELAFAMTTVKDVYYLAHARLKQLARNQNGELTSEAANIACDIAWSIAEGMSDVATPIGMDLGDYWLASKLRGTHRDLEDNLVIAAAERIDADYVITSDKQLLANPHFRTMSPSDMVDHLRMLSETNT